MKHFINLKDIPAKDLRKILISAKSRKKLRNNLSNLEIMNKNIYCISDSDLKEIFKSWRIWINRFSTR